ncbi:D-2-hydroxyacid dehydrogenase [Heyndrickxia sporothermodurans]|uniref:D-2-hydroxyacid dehydrogenase n=1 Tax=Heyndrickxia sporothermodurans TaxID=46224 RepID=UPI002DBDA1B2|nr:D-2-hydroxyacid dehydrogenase [Heyndrickxia sporothermodurans]MEB6550140.1 D-2-hydroxyacid dehydrogenase [Heyndrickxia sporothermodurans]
MSQRKLVITQNLDQGLYGKVKETVPDWNIIAGKESSVWKDHLIDAEIIVGWKKEVKPYGIDRDSKLKWLQSWSAGVDSFPLEELNAKNIFLTTASGVHAYPISETIFALMLGLTRKIHTYVRNQQSKTWHHAHLSLEMHGKTVGIIGAGAIGKETAKIAKAFGMKVIGIRHSDISEESFDEMYITDHLNSILPQCDYVVVTTPLTDETYHLFGNEQFQLMKESAFFINIGRGEIVVEEELVRALEMRSIAGAGLDVFEKEPLSEQSPLWNLENVIITPHTAGSTEHYDARVIEDIFIPNLKQYLQEGVPKINLVDFKKGY